MKVPGTTFGSRIWVGLGIGFFYRETGGGRGVGWVQAFGCRV